MSLKVTEQLQIIYGTVKPPNNLLIDVLGQVALNHAVWLYNNQKVTTNNPDAKLYQSKIIRLMNQVLEGDTNQIQNLKKICVAIIGDTYTFAQVQGADDDAWESALTAIINRAYELLSGTTLVEKQDYDSL